MSTYLILLLLPLTAIKNRQVIWFNFFLPRPTIETFCPTKDAFARFGARQLNVAMPYQRKRDKSPYVTGTKMEP